LESEILKQGLQNSSINNQHTSWEFQNSFGMQVNTSKPHPNCYLTVSFCRKNVFSVCISIQSMLSYLSSTHHSKKAAASVFFFPVPHSS